GSLALSSCALKLKVPTCTCPENSAATELFTLLAEPSLAELAATPTAATIRRLTMVKATTRSRSSPRTRLNATPGPAARQTTDRGCRGAGGQSKRGVRGGRLQRSLSLRTIRGEEQVQPSSSSARSTSRWGLQSGFWRCPRCSSSRLQSGWTRLGRRYFGRNES